MDSSAAETRAESSHCDGTSATMMLAFRIVHAAAGAAARAAFSTGGCKRAVWEAKGIVRRRVTAATESAAPSPTLIRIAASDSLMKPRQVTLCPPIK